MNLTEAYERLQRHRDSLQPSVRDAVDVVLGARCETCRKLRQYAKSQECKWWKPALSVRKTHGCLAWEQREETA